MEKKLTLAEEMKMMSTVVASKTAAGNKVKPAEFTFQWTDARNLELAVRVDAETVLMHRTKYKDQYGSGAVGYYHVLKKNNTVILNSGFTAASIGTGYADKVKELGYDPAVLNGYILWIRHEASATRPEEK